MKGLRDAFPALVARWRSGCRRSRSQPRSFSA